MTLKDYPLRSAVTILGLLCFAILAAGSKEEKGTYTPPPELVGKQSAMGWAKSSSAALASKLQEVQAARSEAQSEVYRLEQLKSQFPEQASKISATITEWQQVIIKLDAAISGVGKKISDAYVSSQIGEENGDRLLEEIAENWSPIADDALRAVRAQKEKSGI